MTINSIILNHLNNYKIESTNYSYSSQYLESGLDGNTLINTIKGPKCISDIKIGDLLSDDNQVTGKIQLNTYFFKFYKLDNLIVSSNFKIFYNNIWQNIEVIPDINLVKSPDKSYHLTTEKGYFYTVYNLQLRDYHETCDRFVNNKIDDLIKLI